MSHVDRSAEMPLEQVFAHDILQESSLPRFYGKFQDDRSGLYISISTLSTI